MILAGELVSGSAPSPAPGLFHEGATRRTACRQLRGRAAERHGPRQGGRRQFAGIVQTRFLSTSGSGALHRRWRTQLRIGPLRRGLKQATRRRWPRRRRARRRMSARPSDNAQSPPRAIADKDQQPIQGLMYALFASAARGSRLTDPSAAGLPHAISTASAPARRAGRRRLRIAARRFGRIAVELVLFFGAAGALIAGALMLR